MLLFVGIEIGGSKLQVVSGDAGGRIHQRRRFTVEPAQGAQGILRHIEQGLREVIGRDKPQSAGVGFGGPLDWQTGRISRSHHIEGWSGFELGKWVERIIAAPASVDNDGNVAALGEARYGAGVGFNPVFYVTLGSGIGGGLVVDGRIYHGAKPGEAEIGHVRLDRSGTTLESRCSGWAVDARIRELVLAHPTSVLAQRVRQDPGPEARHLGAAIQQGDLVACRLLQEVSEDLAFALSHAVHLFHPQIIVLGGGLARVGEPLRAAVERALDGFIMDAFRPCPKIALTALDEDVVPKGALELAKQQLPP